MRLFVDWFILMLPYIYFFEVLIMKGKFFDKKILILYAVILSIFLAVPLLGNHAVTVFSENNTIIDTVIIDAGHGGVDGGAVSYTGVYESHINLEIAIKLNDLMHLIGIPTIMVRSTDMSVYTQGETIAAKKISDIKERVRLVNTTPNALLISIHQNSFPDHRYSGAQVFYNDDTESAKLAKSLQLSLQENLDSSNQRKAKKVSGVYLMDHINCTGILVECGFLSNIQEEILLRDPLYQKKLCVVIASTITKYLNT